MSLSCDAASRGEVEGKVGERSGGPHRQNPWFTGCPPWELLSFTVEWHRAGHKLHFCSSSQQALMRFEARPVVKGMSVGMDGVNGERLCGGTEWLVGRRRYSNLHPSCPAFAPRLATICLPFSLHSRACNQGTTAYSTPGPLPGCAVLGLLLSGLPTLQRPRAFLPRLMPSIILNQL